MAGVFCEGFDCYGAVSEMPYNLVSTWSLITGRGGIGNALRDPGGSGTRTISIPVAGFTGSKAFIGMGFRTNAARDGGSGRCVWQAQTSGGAAIATLTVNTSGVLQFRSGSGTGTVRLDSTSPITFNVWYHIEVEFDLLTTATGTARIWINGAPAGEVTGVVTAASTSPIAFLYTEHPTAMSDYDDITVVDPASPGPTSRLGDRRVGASFATADTAEADFTPSTGTDGYAMIDEAEPDGDTTYISSDTVGDRSLFKFTAPADKEIDFIRLMVRARKEDIGGGNLKLITKSAVEEDASAELGVALSYAYTDHYVQGDPDDDSPLDTASFQALDIGVELV
jgi:hypothetical protein